MIENTSKLLFAAAIAIVGAMLTYVVITLLRPDLSKSEDLITTGLLVVSTIGTVTALASFLASPPIARMRRRMRRYRRPTR